MLVQPNISRRSFREPWSEKANKQKDSDAGSLAAVCGMSLTGLTISLFALGPLGIDAVVIVLGSGIIVAAICALASRWGR